MTTRLTLLAAALIALTAPAMAGEFTVTDGDTFRVGDDRIRLWGYDAPEVARRGRPAEPCSAEATEALTELLSHGYRCEPPPWGSTTSFDRLVRRCWTLEGIDIGGEIVRRGLGTDEPDYSRGEYADEEAEARQAGRGMWGGQCE